MTNNQAYNVYIDGESATLQLLAPLLVENSAHYESALSAGFYPNFLRLTVDCSAVERYDSYAVLFIVALRKKAQAKNITIEFSEMSADLQAFLSAMEAPLLVELPLPEKRSKTREFFVHVGDVVLRIFHDGHSFIEFVGDLVLNSLRLLRRPSAMRWKDFPAHFTRAGVNAVPIVTLIGFLMGLIIAYQGAVQLHQFGADMFLADLVGISITRELGPLMTAIIVAGRSGSAFAAEIGTMKVSEEIDALNVMGFNVARFLVLPRVFSVMLAIPILTLFSDIAGLAGGLIVGVTVLDISITGYLAETQFALTFAHLFSGLFKSIALGGLIGTVGCFRGLQVQGGAESVGKYTTAAVVTSIFLIIVADAIFTLLYRAIGV